MERMAARQTSHIIVVFEGVDTDSASVARRPQTFWWERGVNMLVVVFIVIIMVILSCVLVQGVCIGIGIDITICGMLRPSATH